mmetsp:Transcript_6028/g.20575  ORF Transcript_6028/g.20575 Transcript_6028/m.20575 type:complete len:335 (-) Transcript_6028:25-1029(-)
MDAVAEAFETFRQARDAYKRARDAAHANNRDRGVGRLGLPADVLHAILGYSDLNEVAACAAASSELNRGLANLSPGFERSLVIRRFPILSVVEDARSESMTTPHALFRLFCEQPSRSFIRPTAALRDYGFLLEIELRDEAVTEFDRTQFNQRVFRESLFLDTGLLREGGNRSVIEFHPPGSVFDRVSKLWRDSEGNMSEFKQHVHFRVMATRRGVQGLQLARLYRGQGRVNTDGSFAFEDVGRSLGHYDGSEAAKFRCWLEEELYEHEVQLAPTVQLLWQRQGTGIAIAGAQPSPTTASLTFGWYYPTDEDAASTIPMDDLSACNALERYANWV